MSEIEPVPRIGRGRCGCASTECTCRVLGTGTVTVIGSGTEGDPMSFQVAAQIAMQALDTPMVNLTLTGSGSPADPYVLSGTTSATSSDEFVFLASASPYTQNIGPEYRGMAVTCIGGGGGGGSGDDGPNAIGGGGGRGGAITQTFVDLPPSATGWQLSITSGLGGTGAVNPSPAPNAGANSMVSRRIAGSADPYVLVARADGGTPGFPGNIDGGQTPNEQVQIGQARGGDGRWASGVSPSSDTAWSPGGGGAGAGIGTNARPLTPGGYPLVRSGLSNLVGGAGGTAGGGPGGPGLIGGGGGGGGAASDLPSGNGGNGGAGVVRIVVW